MNIKSRRSFSEFLENPDLPDVNPAPELQKASPPPPKDNLNLSLQAQKGMTGKGVWSNPISNSELPMGIHDQQGNKITISPEGATRATPEKVAWETGYRNSASKN